MDVKSPWSAQSGLRDSRRATACVCGGQGRREGRGAPNRGGSLPPPPSHDDARQVEEHREGADEERAPGVLDEEDARQRWHRAHLIRHACSDTRLVGPHRVHLLLGAELRDVRRRREEEHLEGACEGAAVVEIDTALLLLLYYAVRESRL